MGDESAYKRIGEVFVVRQKACFRTEEIDESIIPDSELRQAFSVFKATLKETALAMQSLFNMSFASTLDAKFNELLTKNRLEVYAQFIRKGKADASEEIWAEALEITHLQMKSLSDDELRESAAERLLKLSDSWSDLVAEPNTVMLRQSCVMLWSACESLLRECFRVLVNRDPSLATQLFASEETKKIWSSRDFSLELIERAAFDLKNCMGDVLLEINPMINLRAIRAGYSVLSKQDQGVVKVLKSQPTYDLFTMRNLVAHRNGFVDEKFVSESRFAPVVGDRILFRPSDFEDMHAAAKSIAVALFEWLRSDWIRSDKGSA